ncbi:hypothetical protein BMF94_1420 [Rhodotorula taiwanensis]|uniref:JmjC domain-containing protein n=1 Tax=Rhodotorula taiwanensis TaxID=741276 RepID=A0A2S5BFG9_9BASI|nr:hypothetical protein BMF94_1420 [Rhodotorula taiwanensis]
MNGGQPAREPGLPSGTFFHPFRIPVPKTNRQPPPSAAPSSIRAALPTASTSAYKPFGEPVKAIRDEARARPVQTAGIRDDRQAFSLPLPLPPPQAPPAAGPSHAPGGDMRRAALVSGSVRVGGLPSEEAARAWRNGPGVDSLSKPVHRPLRSSADEVLPATMTSVPPPPPKPTSSSQSSSHAGQAHVGPSQPGASGSGAAPSASGSDASTPVVYKLPTPYKGRNYAEKRPKAPASSTGSFAPFSAIIRGVPFDPSAIAVGSTTEARPSKRPRVASPAIEVVAPKSVPPSNASESSTSAQSSPSAASGSKALRSTAPVSGNLTVSASSPDAARSLATILAAVDPAHRSTADRPRSSNRSALAPPPASRVSARIEGVPAPAPAIPPATDPMPAVSTDSDERSEAAALGSSLSGALRKTQAATEATTKPVVKETKVAAPVKKQKSFELEVPIYVKPKATEKVGLKQSARTRSAAAKPPPFDVTRTEPAADRPRAMGKGKERMAVEHDGHASDGSSSSSLTPIESSASSSDLTPLNSSDDEAPQSGPRVPQKRVGPPKWARLPARPPKQPRASRGRISYAEPTDEEFLLAVPVAQGAALKRSARDSQAVDDQNSDDAVSRGLMTGDWTSRPAKGPNDRSQAEAKPSAETAKGLNGSAQTDVTRALPGMSSAEGSSSKQGPSYGRSTPSARFLLASPAATPASAALKGRRRRPSNVTNDQTRSARQAASELIALGEQIADDGSAAPLRPKAADVNGNMAVSIDWLAADVVDEARSGKHGFHLQAKSCAAWVSTLPAPSEGPPVSRCHECIAKRSGFICCFQGVRSFPLDAEGRVLPYPVFRDFEGDDEKATLPTVFNGPLTAERGALLRSAIAEHSQASLKAEVDHAERPESVRLPKQLGTTYTCDGCATSILFASWMCTTCAREFCRECRDELETLPIEEIRQRAGSRRLFTPGPRGDIGGTNVYTVDKLTRCVSTDRHGLEQWIPIVRIDRVLLRQTVANMTWWKVNRPLSVPGPLTQELLDYHFVQPDAMEVSLKYLKVPGRYLPPMLGSGPDLALQATRSGMTQSHDVLQTDRTTLPSGFHSLDKAALPVQLHSFAAGLASSAQTGSSRQLRRPGAPPPLSKALSPLDLFSALWQRGCPVVVDLAPEHYPSLPWDPDFFVERFGAERCRIGSARVKQTLRDGTTVDCERNATVGDFFASFGKARDHSDIEKIKDWPSARDFKVEYPDLWEDFMSILPAGCVTRRDGALDFAAHMPAAANPPDLGPKGYFSQISDAMPGGAGSTKLHTVNIMLWSSDAPDGSPGVAAWDLFRAEDAELIRDFLYEQIALQEGLQDAAEARRYHDDPIHAQRFYLDAGLLNALHRSKGVRPYRILQRPGQAVFIPAAVAHQVCNLADCIKVATDFVSIENLERCSRVTSQFRKQTKDKTLWRTDVLQLKSMLLWAWYRRVSEPPRPRAIGDGLYSGNNCIGKAHFGPELDATRCHSQNVCIELQKPVRPQQWDYAKDWKPEQSVNMTYYRPATARDTPHYSDRKHEITKPWVRLHTDNYLIPHVVYEPLPADSVWSPAEHAILQESFWPENFGHSMGDDFFSAFHLAQSFGIWDRSDIQLIMHPACWDRGRVCFRNLYTGMSRLGTNFSSENMLPPFLGELRATAGLERSPRPRHQRITVFLKHGRRTFLNYGSLVEHLRRRFEVEVDLLDPAELSIGEQLAYLKDTTVLITPCGGLSYSGLFLPKGTGLIVADYWHLEANVYNGTSPMELQVFAMNNGVTAYSFPLEARIWNMGADIQMDDSAVPDWEAPGEWIHWKNWANVTIDLERMSSYVYSALLSAEVSQGWQHSFKL